MEDLLQDIRYAWRQIRSAPGFATIAILTFAIGLGTNTAMFSMMDAVVFRPLAVPELELVVEITEHRGGDDSSPVAMANFEDWKRQSRTFADLAIQSESALSLTGAGDPEHVQATRGSQNLLDLLGVQPWQGRNFRPGEDQAGHDQEAILSYSFWQNHFDQASNVLGRQLLLDGKAYTIVGVMPQGFHYAATSDLFLPLPMTAEIRNDRSRHGYTVIGRLRRGVTLNQARAEFQGIDAGLARAYPQTNLGWGAQLKPLIETINGEYTPMYMRMMMGVGFILLLIVCANISNLQFSRSLRRRPEIAIRSAMGAGRARILRQLLTESILLSLMGGAAGILIAKVNLHLNLIAMPQRIARFMPGWSNIGLNWRVLAYSMVLAAIVGIVSGVAPALAAMRVAVSEQLKAGGRTVSEGSKSHRMRNVFAVAQIALSVALVAGAALMATGMSTMLHATRRFDPSHLLTFGLVLPQARYQTAVQQTAFYDQTLERIRQVPGVSAANLTTAFPYNGAGVWWQDFVIEHQPTQPGEFRSTQRITITPDYLASMHVPLLTGRALSASDGANTLPVAVVSQKFVDSYFHGRNPIGQRVLLGKGEAATPWVTIVGVVGDVVTLWVDRTPQPAVYLSHAQFPVADSSYAVRTSGDPLAVAAAVRHAIGRVDAELPVDNLESYDTYLHEALIGLSYVVVMMAVNAGIALILSAIGIFGVMANTVTERTHEIGIRLALGADRARIERMVIRRGLILAGIGLALGLPLAIGLAHAVASLIYGVGAGDKVIFTLTSLAIVVVSFVATWLPARRAAGVEPMTALRSE